MKNKGIIFFLLFLSSCKSKNENISRIVVRLSGTSLDSVYVRQISMIGQSNIKIDSGLLRSPKDSLVFEFPLSSDILYQFTLKFSNSLAYCIPDAPEIHILMDMKRRSSIVTGSAATLSLLNFNREQDSLSRKTKMLFSDLNNLNRSNEKDKADSLQKVVKALYNTIQQRYRHFADTVSNSVAFLENFDHIEFGDDLTGMKKIVDSAKIRFLNNPGIARLDTQVLKLIHIREKELQIGDIFPSLQLPDLDGHIYSTNTNAGKYLYIDFWATYCEKCMAYDRIKPQIFEDPKLKNLVLIHVALDDHLKICRQIVESLKMPGIQLIDQKIWEGETADKLAIDSIPYNFLVGPDSRILSKAISADSLLFILKKYIR